MRKRPVAAFPVAVIRWELIAPDEADDCVNTMTEAYTLASAEVVFSELVAEHIKLNGIRSYDIHDAWLKGEAVFKNANVRIIAERFERPFKALYKHRDDPQDFLRLPDIASWVSRAPLGREDFIRRVSALLLSLPDDDFLAALLKEPMTYSFSELMERAVNQPYYSEEAKAPKNAVEWMCMYIQEPLTQEALLDIFYGIDDMGGHDIRRLPHPPLFDRSGSFVGWSERANKK